VEIENLKFWVCAVSKAINLSWFNKPFHSYIIRHLKYLLLKSIVPGVKKLKLYTNFLQRYSNFQFYVQIQSATNVSMTAAISTDVTAGYVHRCYKITCFITLWKIEIHGHHSLAQKLSDYVFFGFQISLLLIGLKNCRHRKSCVFTNNKWFLQFSASQCQITTSTSTRCSLIRHTTNGLVKNPQEFWGTYLFSFQAIWVQLS
jgi:hypothetical protein